ncbi:MAG: hypothetical protein QOI38_2577 [Sphingomonadales bacterium]|jgi:lysylphosphatidylglycerol synthetase-like protein (DUF2156 family)|nr:hypothetical protein [Sphingomonadales bacterium]
MSDEQFVDGAGTAGTSTSTLFNIARGAKAIALLCFLLPFVTVSCAGQPLARITGMQLATGSIQPIGQNGMPGAPSTGAATGQHYGLDIFALAAAVLIVIALVLTFVLARRRAALIAMVLAAVAAVLLVFDVFVRIKGAATAQIREGMGNSGGTAPSGAGADFERQMQQMVNSISVDPALGFWLCILALVAAIVINNMVRSRRADL